MDRPLVGETQAISLVDLEGALADPHQPPAATIPPASDEVRRRSRRPLDVVAALPQLGAHKRKLAAVSTLTIHEVRGDLVRHRARR